MSAAETILLEMSEKQGWDEDTQMALLRSFVQSQQEGDRALGNLSEKTSWDAADRKKFLLEFVDRHCHFESFRDSLITKVNLFSWLRPFRSRVFCHAQIIKDEPDTKTEFAHQFGN